VTGPPHLRITTVSLSTDDPAGLAAFYRELLGYELVAEEPDWLMLAPPDDGVRLAIQRERDYTPPVWPAGPGDQQMMMHLEIQVDDLDAAEAHARRCGARRAEQQPQDDVRVCFDPAGHPFCLWIAT
jgi:catechol 2,3-dioxygenase-like lactoylglutathione lyase family enzyme